MADGDKNILVVARYRKTEALRMASGLTLLDDPVRVLVCGELEPSDELDIQLESLDFADVPLERVADGAVPAALANAVTQADVVYII
ncbi:MAG: hypothetical protein CVV05_13790 [Gammaproteobacteria bacterium HGW-Gammaproteobacteria-1]|nr:MAG: hypothetical protein CVV05_13790 [Gammaproteobacteria bacterium HGW-Gammaproteobacteria-1]